MSMNHEASKRRWDDNKGHGLNLSSTKPPLFYQQYGGHVGPSALPVDRKLLALSALSDEIATAVVPQVTIVLEGRSICHRIQMNKHNSYESFARALHHLFLGISSDDCEDGHVNENNSVVDLSNAIPGYMIAYEDMEDDLLLVGDLNWKDFVRVVKRIRIIPAKATRKKPFGNAN